MRKLHYLKQFNFAKIRLMAVQIDTQDFGCEVAGGVA